MTDTTIAPTPTIAGTDANGNAVNIPYAGSAEEKQNAPAATPSLIVTSGASRSNYADNVNTMNTAVSNLPSAPSSGNPTTYAPLQSYLQTNGKDFSMDNLKDLAKEHGMTEYTGTDSQNAMLAGFLKSASPDGKTAVTDPNAGKKNADGTPTVTGNASLDPTVMKAYTDTLGNLDAGISAAKDALTQATATMQNDPAAVSAVNAIMAKYDRQIQLMKDKNAILLGSYRNNAARSGSMQYANDMYSNFMSDEQDRATARITDLITTETQMVLKAQQAYKDQDTKAFASATKAYQDANKAKIDTINKLLTATNNQVKLMQAQAKIDQADIKNQLASDTKTSTSISDAIVKSIKDSGVTDQKQIDDYITAMAEKNGISNADILRGAVTKARQTADKLDLSARNTNSIIENRGKKNPKGPSLTLKPVEKSTIGSALETGDTVYGVKYNGRGEDGYVDPELYATIYSGLQKTSPAKAQQFLTSYPPEKHLNPANATNANLPTPIVNRLKAKAAKATGTVIPQ